MNLTEEQREAVVYAVSTCCTASEINHFFELIEPEVETACGDNNITTFLTCLEYARRKNTWTKDPTICSVKRLTNQILTWYKDKPFYESIIALFEDKNQTERTVSNDPKQKKYQEALGRMNNTKTQLAGALSNFTIYRENFDDGKSETLLTSEDLEVVETMLNEAQDDLEIAIKLVGSGSLSSSTKVDVTLTGVIESYQNPDEWLKRTPEELQHDAQNIIQTLQQINKALSRINNAILEYPFYSVFRTTEKGALRVIDHKYNVEEGKVIIVSINNEGKIFEDLLITNFAAESGSGQQQVTSKPENVANAGFTSWK